MESDANSFAMQNGKKLLFGRTVNGSAAQHTKNKERKKWDMEHNNNIYCTLYTTNISNYCKNKKIEKS